MYQQEDEQTAGETVCVYKDETNNAFCTRHRSRTPIACSLEPCADVRNSSVANEQKHREGTKQQVV